MQLRPVCMLGGCESICWACQINRLKRETVDLTGQDFGRRVFVYESQTEGEVRSGGWVVCASTCLLRWVSSCCVSGLDWKLPRAPTRADLSSGSVLNRWQPWLPGKKWNVQTFICSTSDTLWASWCPFSCWLYLYNCTTYILPCFPLPSPGLYLDHKIVDNVSSNVGETGGLLGFPPVLIQLASYKQCTLVFFKLQPLLVPQSKCSMEELGKYVEADGCPSWFWFCWSWFPS